MLFSLVRIAFRNVTRNTKRSLITMAAVIIGCAAIVFARGYINGLHKGMIDGITQTMTGDAQIHQKDYLKATDALPLNLTVKLDDKFKEILSSEKRVDAWAGRLRFTGMLSNGLTTSLFIGNALDPDSEPKVTPDLQSDVLPGGKSISNAVPNGVVIADKLANAMSLKVGDTLTLTAATKEGALNTSDVQVVGIRRAGAALSGTEGKIIDIPLQAAQDLLYMPGEATEVVLNIPKESDIEDVVKSLQGQIDSRIPEAGLAVNDWQSVSKFFVDVLNIQDGTLWIVIVVLFAVMVTGIVNTMLMAVMERIREIGTMMAIGVRRTKIIAMFIWEAVALGLIGSCIGSVIGFAAVEFVVYGLGGIQVKPAAYNKPIYLIPFVSLPYLLFVVVIAMLAALLAALYPAYRASKLEPAEALRTL